MLQGTTANENSLHAKNSRICFENLHLVPEFPVWMVLTEASKCQFLSTFSKFQ